MKKLLLMSALSLSALSLFASDALVSFSGSVRARDVSTLSADESQELETLRSNLVEIMHQTAIQLNTQLQEHSSLLDLTDPEKPLLNLNIVIMQNMEQQQTENQEQQPVENQEQV